MHDPCPHVSPIKNSVPRIYPAWHRPPVEQFNLTVVRSWNILGEIGTRTLLLSSTR